MTAVSVTGEPIYLLCFPVQAQKLCFPVQAQKLGASLYKHKNWETFILIHFNNTEGKEQGYYKNVATPEATKTESKCVIVFLLSV